MAQTAMNSCITHERCANFRHEKKTEMGFEFITPRRPTGRRNNKKYHITWNAVRPCLLTIQTQRYVCPGQHYVYSNQRFSNNFSPASMDYITHRVVEYVTAFQQYYKSILNKFCHHHCQPKYRIRPWAVVKNCLIPLHPSREHLVCGLFKRHIGTLLLKEVPKFYSSNSFRVIFVLYVKVGPKLHNENWVLA